MREAGLAPTDYSGLGVWGGTLPQERRTVADVPLPERIEVLMAMGEEQARSHLGMPPWREIVPESAWRLAPDEVERARRLLARPARRPSRPPRTSGGRRRAGLEALALGKVWDHPAEFTRKELSRRLGVRRQAAVLVVGDLIRHGRLVPDKPRARLRVPDENVQVGGVPAALA